MERAGKLVGCVWVCGCGALWGVWGVFWTPPPHHIATNLRKEIATMVVCECEASSNIPELPDEIIRKILSIKHESFVQDLPAMMERNVARREAEASETAQRVAKCEFLSASVLATISLVLVVVFFVVLR